MRLRSGKKVGEDKEQTLVDKNKEGYPNSIGLKTREVRMSTIWELAAPNLKTQPMSNCLCCIR